MQAAENWRREDRPECLYGSVDRAVVAQRAVSSSLVAIGCVGLKDPAQVGGSYDHEMVEAFAPDRTDQPFGMRVLPG